MRLNNSLHNQTNRSPVSVHKTESLRQNIYDTTLRVVALGSVYALSAMAVIMMAKSASMPSPIWVADGIAIGIVLLSPKFARWPLIATVFFVNFLLAVTGGLGVAISFTGSACNALQVVVSVLVMERLAWRQSRAITLRIMLIFYGLIVVMTTGLAAMLQAAFAAWLLGNRFEQDLLTTFISDALGVALLSPLIIIWGLLHQDILQGKATPLPFRPWRVLEGVIAFALAFIVTYLVFSAEAERTLLVRPYMYLCLPALLWLALRFGLRAVTAAMLMTAIVAIYFTLYGLGHFAQTASPERALQEVQVFLLVLSFTIFLPATLFAAQRNTYNQLYDFMRRSEAVLRASGNVVFEINVSTTSVQWSGDTETVLGWSAAKIATIDAWNEKVHVDDLERLIGLRKKLALGETSRESLEYRIFREDGKEIKIGVGAYSATFYDINQRQQQRVIIGLVKDITAIDAMAERNKLLDTSLRQSQKMESLGLLAGGIAHDFNNILAAILGYGEMAQGKLGGSADLNADAERSKLQRYLETILQAAERGRLLVAQVLTFSRRSPEQQGVVDLAALISEVVQLLRGSFKFQIMMDLENRQAMTKGDATALHQLVMNICTNGLQAIAALENASHSKRGLLSVLLTDIQLSDTQYSQPNQVLSRELIPGRYALLRIADDGVGMTAETRARMFDPFFTTKSVGNGTGLGLSLAMSIAHAHGGAIGCDTNIGHGTIFSVYLPYADATTLSAPAIELSPQHGRGQIVMLVDDEAPLRALGEEMLSSLGYTPVVFASSTEALAAFEAAPEYFTAVLTDEVMPEMTGTQLAGRLHALRADLPILIITAYGGAGFQLRAAEVGVRKILKKPYRHHDLAAALAEVFSQK